MSKRNGFVEDVLVAVRRGVEEPEVVARADASGRASRRPRSTVRFM